MNISVNKKALVVAIVAIAIASSVLITYAADELSPYSTNEKGQTYGNGNQISEVGYDPDLILAEGPDGTLGYVYASDLEGDFVPQTPDEAISWQNAHIGEDRVIPLYAVDGETVIGEFVVSGYNPENVTYSY
jgi:hypothetical protein